MNKAPVSLAVLLGITFFLVACSKESSQSVAEKNSPSTNVAAHSIADSWVGKWNGPEGTFLEITGSGGKYEITIQNLDGPRKFKGISTESNIEFERDGIKEVIRATNGAETGMKWLANKSHCLTVKVSEGYCKD